MRRRRSARRASSNRVRRAAGWSALPVFLLATALGAAPPQLEATTSAGPVEVERHANSTIPVAPRVGVTSGPVPVCTWDNGAPADCLGAPASQVDPLFPFFAEAANDFILIDEVNPDEPCRLLSVTVWIVFFNGDDAPDQITGYQVTVYADADEPGQPGGEPNDDGTHSGAVIGNQYVPASDVTPIAITLPSLETIYEVTIPIDLEVPKNQTLWMAVAPEIVFPPQAALMLTQAGPFGHAAVQIFDAAGLPEWTATPGGDCDGDGVPDDADGDGVGDYREIAMSIVGADPTPPPSLCPWDCGNGDQEVGVADLRALLAQWGGAGSCDFDADGVVSTTDLAALLANWGPCPTAPNDECEGRIQLAIGSNSISTAGATPSQPDPACADPAADLWYGFTLPVAGIPQIQTTVPGVLEFYVLNTTCPPDAPFVFCDELPLEAPLPQGSEIAVRLLLEEPGAVEAGGPGQIIVIFEAAIGCFNAVDLEIGETVFGDTSDAFVTPVPDCAGVPSEPGTASDWYRVIGDGTTLTASTCAPGTAFDTRLSVFCGPCSTPGTPCIAANDDSPEPGCGLASTVSFCTTAGREYFVAVHGGPAPLNEGPYELTILSDGQPQDCPLQCPPGNDDCDSRLVLIGDPVCEPYDTTLATTDGPDNPDGLCSDSGAVATAHDIWFHYRVPEDGRLTVDTCEDIACGTADYDTDLVVYGPYANQPTAADCDPDELLDNIAGCNDDAIDFPCGSAAPWHSAVQIPVQAGEWYKLRVGGWDEGERGTGTLHVEIVPDPTGACCIDALCIGTIKEADCLAQGGCLVAWLEGEDCIGFDCTPPPLPCEPGAIGGNGAADGLNGVRPDGAIGGWNFGDLGVAEDIVVCTSTTAISVHVECIDLTTPIGVPSALDLLRVRIYDASAGVFNVDPSVDIPICEADLSVTARTAAKNICGGPFFGADVECWKGAIDCPLEAGTYLLSISFPEVGDVAYFVATGASHPSSPEFSQILGIDSTGAPLFGDPTEQHSSMCLGE